MVSRNGILRIIIREIVKNIFKPNSVQKINKYINLILEHGPAENNTLIYKILLNMESNFPIKNKLVKIL